MSQRSARYVSAKSLRYCTNRISAEKNALSVTPDKQQHRRRQSAMTSGRERVHDEHGDCRRRPGSRRPTPPIGQARAERDRDHRAERRAGRDAQRVRRRQRILQQSLKDDARGGERRRRPAPPPACAAVERGRRSARPRCRRTAGSVLKTFANDSGVEPMNGAASTASDHADERQRDHGQPAAKRGLHDHASARATRCASTPYSVPTRLASGPRRARQSPAPGRSRA